MSKRSHQRVFVIQRRSDQMFLHCDKSNWTYDVSEAFLVSKTKFKGVVRVDLGRDLDDHKMTEVVPSLEIVS